ncbi:homocysteine-responsive endoplasmic reticulum-resident ubiquitin-like domain member 2 protein [Vespa crabro]|uniref:homocysteine-responsive endoplasmic reticulum-resident ubiquitin-like domain member 2 protein n=1 Tax=Vespa crabro TaxID=7445 RepID=UPI001F023309|nr:homocysteine-responsive endoplasmic reticulum-resident ubiquitin-like domain member 2 protein [Vespa crabro]
MMESDTVKLIIKAPNQQIKDQLIKCDIGWSIGRLKEYLSEVYPSKPESADQKLIYAGQLLNNSSYLKDILRHCDDLEDQAYTIHLVCTSQKNCANKVFDRTQVNESVNVNSAIRNNVDYIRTNNIQSQNQSTNNIITQPSPTQLYSMQQYFDPRNSQQVAWMQQAYTHYFTQYMQLMAAQGIQLQSTIPYVQQMNINPNEVTQNTYMNNNNNNNNNVRDNQPQAAVQDAADINAGNNNAIGEDGVFNPDWLDFFYMLSRIIILFSIVYFYSSPLRFLIVTFLGFVIYLYQSGFFRLHIIYMPENNNVRPDNNNQVLQNEGAAPQVAPAQQNGQVPTVQPEARTNANEENEEERPGALAFTWTFFSSFFASLIPDQPNVI